MALFKDIGQIRQSQIALVQIQTELVNELKNQNLILANLSTNLEKMTIIGDQLLTLLTAEFEPSSRDVVGINVIPSTPTQH